MLGPSDAITTIDDVSQIKLDFTVPEKFLALMQPGRTIYASGASWQDRQFEGVVRAVGSRVDPVTRAGVVRAIIPNEEIITVIAYWKYSGTEWGIKSLHLDDWSIEDVTPLPHNGCRPRKKRRV